MPVDVQVVQGASHAITANVGWATTGITPPSGNGVLDGSGPWMIEEQTLDVYFQRVPFAHREILSDQHIDLSGIKTAVSGNIHATFLIGRVEAKWSVKKTYDHYATQGHQRPQKFEITAASADYKGNEYAPYPTKYFGPHCDIITIQPFEKRRAWVSGVDVVSAVECSAGYTFQYGLTNGFVGGLNPEHSEGCFDNHRVWLGDGWRELTEVGGFTPQYHVIYKLVGTYLGSAEQQHYANQFATVLNNLGYWLRRGMLWKHAGYVVGSAGAEAIDPLYGYNENRHDYS